MDQRQARAFHIAATTKLAPNNGRWRVPSQSGAGTYTVLVTREGTWACTCPDDEAPSLHSVLRYPREPDMTDVLTSLLELSSLPLRAIETQFAIDSSGFGTTNMRTWYSTKHGREMKEREWRKVHAMCGTSTHI